MRRTFDHRKTHSLSSIQRAGSLILEERDIVFNYGSPQYATYSSQHKMQTIQHPPELSDQY